MVRDLFPVNENARIFSLLILVVGVSPILAPTVGGYLSITFGWRSIFLSLSLIAMFTIFLCYKFLPESKDADNSMSLKPKYVLADFKEVFINPQFLIYALAGGIASAGMFAYISGAPFVFIELFNISEKHFGWVFASNATGLIVASQFNRSLLKKYSSEFISSKATLVQVIIAITLFTLTSFQLLNVYTTLLLLIIFMSSQGFFFPNASALAMAPFSKRAGIASALLGCIQMFCSALTSLAVSFLHNGTAIPMTIVIMICALISFVLVLVGQRYHNTAVEVSD